MLEVVQLGCERDDRVLFSNLSFTLSRGELLQVEGANGAGKTTLLRILSGLSRDYQGEIRWNSAKHTSHFADFRLAAFYLGHKPAVKAELTPVENLQWRARLRNEQPDPDSQLSALEQVNLAGYEHLPCGQLSAGQHRRVALADLALSQTPLWILDEPFTAIDVYGVAWLESLLGLHTGRGGMVIFTSHQSLSSTVGQFRRVRLEDYRPTAFEEADYGQEALS
ncbi:MAG: cytochrome c biogenesis heme-transporting ATPase CcmA [Endozoicomonas sp.]